MTKTARPVNIHQNYYAHLYFDRDTLPLATTICRQAGALFDVSVGRVHQKPVGPHPMWSCQLSFNAAEFDRFIPWLDQHRQHLTVFVHGLTGDDIRDHTEYAYWLGGHVDLNLSVFGI